MKLFKNNKPQPPSFGYMLKLWKQKGYRATAHAYMKRENIDFIENENGHTYSINEIEKAMIN